MNSVIPNLVDEGLLTKAPSFNLAQNRSKFSFALASAPSWRTARALEPPHISALIISAAG